VLGSGEWGPSPGLPARDRPYPLRNRLSTRVVSPDLSSNLVKPRLVQRRDRGASSGRRRQRDDASGTGRPPARSCPRRGDVPGTTAPPGSSRLNEGHQVQCLPPWVAVRQVAPLDPGPGEEQDRLDHLAARIVSRHTTTPCWVEEGLDQRPLRVPQFDDGCHIRARAPRPRQVLWHDGPSPSRNIQSQMHAGRGPIASEGEIGSAARLRTYFRGRLSVLVVRARIATTSRLRSRRLRMR
jgi:hypothetical protein